MSEVIAINLTSGPSVDVLIRDLGVIVPASGQETLTDIFSIDRLRQSEDLVNLVDQGKIKLNDGSNDITSLDEASDYIGTPGVSYEVLTFNILGVLQSGTRQDGTRIMNRPGKIMSVRGYLEETSGTEGQVTVDVNKNGTTIFTTQSSRMEFLYSEGANSKKKSGAIDVTTFAAGDDISVDIDEVMTGASKDLTICVEVRYG